jgi:hypothetical protein
MLARFLVFSNVFVFTDYVEFSVFCVLFYEVPIRLFKVADLPQSILGDCLTGKSTARHISLYTPRQSTYVRYQCSYS